MKDKKEKPKEVFNNYFYSFNVPCLKCRNRKVSCHATCPEYIEYRKTVKRYNIMKNKHKEY